ncbi:hypothetical protein GUJ93_ZPchr0004g39828 [Zizania palustris]|uniref:Retroviral polymerase SH3-like domain-containing protein n=1 Tax=Zizania palustris TaxID=103762 RepID=A0A8J5VZ88_ZIZPA|nr:hypothetical protein GUJ93_ZPchr0004g39828 [Zizania palustris]
MHKGYKCLHAATGRVYISRDVGFDENIYPFAHKNLAYTSSTLISESVLLPWLSSLSPQSAPVLNEPTDHVNVSVSLPNDVSSSDVVQHVADPNDSTIVLLRFQYEMKMLWKHPKYNFNGHALALNVTFNAQRNLLMAQSDIIQLREVLLLNVLLSLNLPLLLMPWLIRDGLLLCKRRLMHWHKIKHGIWFPNHRVQM